MRKGLQLDIALLTIFATLTLPLWAEDWRNPAEPRTPLPGTFFYSPKFTDYTNYRLPSDSPLKLQLNRSIRQFLRRGSVLRPAFEASLYEPPIGRISVAAAGGESATTSHTTARHGLIIIPPPNPTTLFNNAVKPSKVGTFNYNETTGIINSPAAKVAPAGSFQNFIEFQDVTFPGVGLYTSKADGPRELDFANAVFQNIGDTHYILGLGGGVELSVESFHFALDELIFGGKYLAVADAEDHPAFAVGVQSLNAKPEDGTHNAYTNPHPDYFNFPSFFGVLGHTFALDDNGMSLELEGGIGTGRLRNGFFSTEYHLNRNIGIAADWDGTIVSTALKISPSDRFQFVLDAQMQTPVRFGASFRFIRGATPDRNGPDWAKDRDKSHVPEPDVLMFPEIDHTIEPSVPVEPVTLNSPQIQTTARIAAAASQEGATHAVVVTNQESVPISQAERRDSTQKIRPATEVEASPVIRQEDRQAFSQPETDQLVETPRTAKSPDVDALILENRMLPPASSPTIPGPQNRKDERDAMTPTVSHRSPIEPKKIADRQELIKLEPDTSNSEPRIQFLEP